MKAVPYYRVSTKKQGRSGLGLEAQQKAVRDYARYNDIVLLDEFIDVESGSNNRRPVLEQALKLCKRQKAVLLVAKLDRLSRDALFILKLRESSVKFIAVDNPDACTFVIQILAAVAQKERKDASVRTINALAAAKARGVQLGKHGRDILSKQNRDAADQFARRIQMIIEEIRLQGYHTVRDITVQLNYRKVPTFRGHDYKWHVASVHQILTRLTKKQTLH